MGNMSSRAQAKYASFEAVYHDAVASYKSRWEEQLRSAQKLVRELAAKDASARAAVAEAGVREIARSDDASAMRNEKCPPNTANALSGLLQKGFVVSNQNPRSTVRSILQR